MAVGGRCQGRLYILITGMRDINSGRHPLRIRELARHSGFAFAAGDRPECGAAYPSWELEATLGGAAGRRWMYAGTEISPLDAGLAGATRRRPCARPGKLLYRDETFSGPMQRSPTQWKVPGAKEKENVPLPQRTFRCPRERSVGPENVPLAQRTFRWLRERSFGPENVPSARRTFLRPGGRSPEPWISRGSSRPAPASR